MTETSIFEDISTRLQRISELAREKKDRSFLALAHHIDNELLGDSVPTHPQERGCGRGLAFGQGVRGRTGDESSVAAHKV